MRTLEIRRHTMRTKPGQHLSQQGVELARRVGEGMGRFDVVVTSTLPRAFETAIAMGFAVDDEIEQLAQMNDDVGNDWESWRSFADIARVFAERPAAREFAATMAQTWRRVALLADNGGRALAISHGFIIEFGAFGCFAPDSFAQWGDVLSYCEGIRADFDGAKWSNAQLIRVGRPN